MKTRLWKRMLSAFTALTLTAGTFAAFSLPAMAEEAEAASDVNYVKVYPTADRTFRKANDSISGTAGTLDVGNSAAGVKDSRFTTAFKFDLTGQNADRIKSAKLEFVVYQNYGDMQIMPFFNDWTEESKYQYSESTITTNVDAAVNDAAAGTGVIASGRVGQGTKMFAVYNNDGNADLSKYTAGADITSYITTKLNSSENTASVLIVPNFEGSNNNLGIFSKEVGPATYTNTTPTQNMTWTGETEQGITRWNSIVRSFFGVKADQFTDMATTNYDGLTEEQLNTLKPRLLIEYKPFSATTAEGTKYYSTLLEAANAVSDGGTIQLYEDYNATSDERIFVNSSKVNKNFTVNGNGHTIDLQTGNNLLFEADNKTLTLENITIKGGTQTTLSLKNNATVTLKNTKVINGQGHPSVYVQSTGAKLYADSDCEIDGFNARNDSGAAHLMPDSGETRDIILKSDTSANNLSVSKVGALYSTTGGTTSAATDYELYTNSSGNIAIRETLTEANSEASVKHDDVTTNYATFAEAVAVAAEGDTITLLKDVSTSGFTNLDKSITIEGEEHTLTQENGQWDYMEVKTGKTVTINKLTITGNKLNVPQTAVINATDCNFSALNLGGNGGTSKGVLTNSKIDNLSTYGKIELENTEITNIEFTDIKKTGTDQPTVIGDNASTVTNVTFGSNVAVANINFPYTLFSGEMTKPSVTLAGTVFADGYTYSDGIISAKTALTSVTLANKAGIKIGDTLNAAISPDGASVDYTWERSSDGENWTTIDGATDASYTLDAVDFDNYVRVTATGTGSYSGSVSDKTTDKVAKIKEAAPTGLGIDYVAETITGLAEKTTYIINGSDVTTGEGETTTSVTSYIPASAESADVTVIKKATDANHADSDAATVTVPKRPAAPEGLGATKATDNSATDGAITGTTALMEYKLSSGSTWKNAADTTTNGLAAGTYDVRVKATSSAFASAAAQVTIGVADKITVRFMNGSSVHDTQQVISGTTPTEPANNPTKEADAEFTYTFLGWNTNSEATEAAALAAVTSDTDYYAIYSKTKNKYDIVWKVGETTLKTDNLEYGTTPSYDGETPTKDSDNGYDYTFNKWSPDIVAVVGAATYTALFNSVPRTYTITYNMQGHGEAPSDTSYTYGTPKTLPSPTADGFTFDGWYKEDTYSTKVESISATDYGNLTLYAKWTEIPSAPKHNITLEEGLDGKLQVDAQASEGSTVTVTVTGDNFVKGSLLAVYSGNVIQAAGSGNIYTFTMPAADITLSALFDEEGVKSIIASDDYCYNVQGKNANKGHYIRNQSDADEKNLALGFDVGNLDLTGKIVKLQIVKTGYSAYTSTLVNLINGNPWATSDFNYTLASGASTNVIASGGEDGGNAQYYKCTYTLDSSKLTKVDGKLYFNLERAEQNSSQGGNDYFAISSAQADNGKKATKAEYLPKLIITEPTYYNITARSGITVDERAVAGNTVTLTAEDIVANSLIVKNVTDNTVVQTTDNGSGEYTFTMPESDVNISGLVNTENRIYVVPTSVKAINSTGETTNNYYIKDDHALGMTFEIPSIPTGKEIDSISLHFTRQNSAAGQTTNIYDQTSGGFAYKNDSDYIAQYSGGTIAAQKLNATPSAGAYKLLLSYDSGVNSEAAGNDYYVVGAGNASCLPRETSQLPYLIIDFVKEQQPAPEKTAPTYELQTDTLNNVFQYHFAGGTTAYNNGEDETGKAYDVYLWVPNNVDQGELKGLVAIKMNLVEVPFAYSQHLRDALEEKGFGILFLVCQKDPYGYNNCLNGFYTRNDYKGDAITYTDSFKASYTTDNKDAADIMNEILAGIAEASGYDEIEDTVPLITIGHSAASGFGNKSANWDKDRVIAQIHMKNGMSGGEAMVPGVPQLQYAAQYTEHAMGAGRDRSVDDARYHITNKRAVSSDYLVSHIIEWGSGHYDWSENATYMLTKYITKAIDARVPANYSETGVLNDLTGTGYIMKPFEKDENGEEQAAGYYRDYLQGWLSDGKANSGASETDKKASFWFFDEEFAKEVNEFTNYAIPESPSSNLTGISGKTYSDIEPFMLMKNPSESTYATTPVTANTVIKPYTTFASNPFSRYGSVRFINYTKLAAPNANASNTANLQGYGTFTVDTYYMNKIPSITAGSGNVVAYDGAGENAYVPENTKAEFLPLIAPYEFVGSEQIDMDGMTKTGDESENVASVTRTTLRFHNDRAYFRSGNAETLKQQYPNHTINTDFGTMDMFGVIKSPEIRGNDGFVTSAFKVTSAQMNIPYVATGNNRTTQTLTLNAIDDVNVNGVSSNPKFAVTYTSSDADLQKFTDVMVEYGPARAVRSGNDTDGYTWEIEILRDQIPKNATYPIEVNVVASNLGKWEKVSGATASKTFNIVSNEPEPDEHSITIESYAEAKGTVTVEGGNSAITTGSTTAAKGTEITVTAAPKDGYSTSTLQYKEGNGAYSDVPSGGKITVGDDNISIKAEFTPIVYNVTYTNADGIEIDDAYKTYTVEAKLTLPQISKEGFRFDGWYIGDERYTEIAKGSTGNKEFTAKWTEITEPETPDDTFDEPYTPDEIKGVNEYGEGTPLSGWFSNDTENNDTAKNSVKTEDGQLIMTNGDDEANLWIGKAYATQEEAKEAARIILKFRYTPGSKESSIYLASASDNDIKAGLNDDTIEGTFKYAEDLGMDAGKTYDVVVTIDNSKHEAMFDVKEANITPMSVSLLAYVDLKAEGLPVDTNTVIFAPAANSTDKLDYFSAELIADVKPALKIGEITQSADKTTVAVSVENPTEETEAGVMLAALYGADHTLKQLKEVNGSAVEFEKATEGTIKLFLWKSLSGEGALEPILPSREKAISTN